MTNDWKPGDVARTRAGGTVARTIARKWVLLEDGLLMNLDHEPRPLLVIDAEDREQVERLASAYIASWLGNVKPVDGTLRITANQMQSALRSMLAPPKPEEPTGLGAVVEDADGVQWLRCFGDAGFYVWRKSDGFDNSRFQWAEVHAVRILGAGVTDAD